MMPDSIFLLNAHPSPFWFKEKQIPNMTEYTRKRNGWDDEKIITTPVQKRITKKSRNNQ